MGLVSEVWRGRFSEELRFPLNKQQYYLYHYRICVFYFAINYRKSNVTVVFHMEVWQPQNGNEYKVRNSARAPITVYVVRACGGNCDTVAMRHTASRVKFCWYCARVYFSLDFLWFDPLSRLSNPPGPLYSNISSRTGTVTHTAIGSIPLCISPRFPFFFSIHLLQLIS